MSCFGFVLFPFAGLDISKSRTERTRWWSRNLSSAMEARVSKSCIMESNMCTWIIMAREAPHRNNSFWAHHFRLRDFHAAHAQRLQQSISSNQRLSSELEPMMNIWYGNSILYLRQIFQELFESCNDALSLLNWPNWCGETRIGGIRDATFVGKGLPYREKIGIYEWRHAVGVTDDWLQWWGGWLR